MVGTSNESVPEMAIDQSLFRKSFVCSSFMAGDRRRKNPQFIFFNPRHDHNVLLAVSILWVYPIYIHLWMVYFKENT